MLTPEDIQSREFLVSLRGYDRDEVHAFLDEVADEFANLLARSKGGPTPVAEDVQPTAPAPQVAEADPEPAPEPEPTPVVETASMSFAAIGAETQRILEAAHAAGEEIRRRAESDADKLATSRLADAQDEVDVLRRQAEQIGQQIHDLTSRRDAVGQRLRQARETVELALIELDGNEGGTQRGGGSVLAPEADVEPEGDSRPTGVLVAVEDPEDSEGVEGA